MNWPEIEVLVEVDEDASGTPVDLDLLRRAVRGATFLAVEDGTAGPLQSHCHVEISLYLTYDDQIQQLNREFRGVDRPTDVLSFSLVHDVPGPQFTPNAEAPLALGDVVISLPYAARQAAELGHPVPMELAWLAIHGTLQLLGYEHNAEERAIHMEALEHRALQALGFAID